MKKKQIKEFREKQNKSSMKAKRRYVYYDKNSWT